MGKRMARGQEHIQVFLKYMAYNSPEEYWYDDPEKGYKSLCISPDNGWKLIDMEVEGVCTPWQCREVWREMLKRGKKFLQENYPGELHWYG
jgi:hypothetical protein